MTFNLTRHGAAGLDCRLMLLIAPRLDPRRDQGVQWLRDQGQPVVYLRLSPRHNVPDVFLGALAAGFQQMVRLDVDLDLRGSLEDAVILLLNSLVDRLHDDLILILEDYDVIHEPVIHEALGLMLDYLPPLLHVVIVAEQEPPLHNLPRLRVRRQMMQVKI